jgi:hypothetical protein
MTNKATGNATKLHVLPVAKGGWAIKKAGSPEPMKTFATKAEATAYAKKVAAKSKGAVVQFKAKKSAAKKAATKKPAAKASVVTHEKWILMSKPAKAGKVSKIAPAKAKKGSPQFGSAKGKFVIATDFEDTPEEFAEDVPAEEPADLGLGTDLLRRVLYLPRIPSRSRMLAGRPASH